MITIFRTLAKYNTIKDLNKTIINNFVRIKLRWIVIVETLLILILIVALVINYKSTSKTEKDIKYGLLSSRIYSGLIEPTTTKS